MPRAKTKVAKGDPLSLTVLTGSGLGTRTAFATKAPGRDGVLEVEVVVGRRRVAYGITCYPAGPEPAANTYAPLAGAEADLAEAEAAVATSSGNADESDQGDG